MKRIGSVFTVLLCLSLLLITLDGSSAAIKVKTIGRSLNSLTAPVPGAPVPPWNIASGLRAIGIQSRAYFKVDTAGSGTSGTPTWSLTKPATSTATLDSAAGKLINSFKADIGGQYIVTATLGTQTASDTVWASKYWGVQAAANAGCSCHGFMPGFNQLVASWRSSAHGTMFKRGITGYLEPERGKGTYRTSCIQCHTTGWDNTANNDNFGFLAKNSGFDTTWYQGLESSGTAYYITTGDTSRYALLSANEREVANIGCESCHGPVDDHRQTADKMKVGVTLEPDPCMVCHDGSRRHSLGTFYNLSAHATRPNAASRSPNVNCQPCHSGAGFLYYIKNNKDTTGISTVWTGADTRITCQVCHDPHDDSKPHQLRTVTLKGDSLRSGYVLPAGLRSNPGLLCATCHSQRYLVKQRVLPNNPPYYGFVDRYGPHGNPQADMFFGAGGWQYGDTTFTGLATHTGLEDYCVTCHMQPRANRLGSGTLPNHTFSMHDTTFATGVYKPTDVCASCHGEIEDFNDVRAFYDFDRNGRIEGVQTEIQGLLTKLKTVLPLDPTSGEPVTRLRDSLLVKGNFNAIAGIWNYYMVVNDGSMGVHNSKYAVRLLYKALGWTPLSVKQLPGMPEDFALNQNYPNPFNPTTNIRFSLPSEQHVKLQVFDITGSLVKTLVDEAISPGNRETTWDGTNQTGAKVASGMYLYRIQAGNYVSVKKMVMLK